MRRLGALSGEARALAAKIALLPPHSLRHTKNLLRQGQQTSYDTALELAANTQAMMHTTADHAEGVAALIEKRFNALMLTHEINSAHRGELQSGRAVPPWLPPRRALSHATCAAPSRVGSAAAHAAPGLARCSLPSTTGRATRSRVLLQ